MNATYRLGNGSTGLDNIALVHGMWVYRPDPRVASVTVTLARSVAFGDLDGDGADDAVVLLVLNSGGTGRFYHLIAVLNRDGRPQQAASRDLGDRQRIQRLAITRQRIEVDRLTQGPAAGMCCPYVPLHQDYALAGAQLVLTASTRAPGDLLGSARL